MTILLTGADGQVGREILALAPARGHTVVATDVQTLDVTDAAAVRQAVAGVDAVVNAAAYTAVDRAETDAATAQAGTAAQIAALDG